MHWKRRVPGVLVLMVRGAPGKRPLVPRMAPRPAIGASPHIGAVVGSPTSAWLMTSMQPGPKPVAVTSVNECTSPPRPNSATTGVPRFTVTLSFVNLHAGCEPFFCSDAMSSSIVTKPPELSVRSQKPGGNVAGSHASRDWTTSPSPEDAPAVAATARLAVATASTLKTARRRKPFDIASSPFPCPLLPVQRRPGYARVHLRGKRLTGYPHHFV